MSPRLACQPFVTLVEVLEATCACELNEDDHGDLIEEFADDASDFLYVLSGGRVFGRCTRTVWPYRPFAYCRPGGMGFGGWGRYGWAGDGYRESWVDYDSVDSIPLQGPETSIVEITIDGLLISPTEYGLLDGNKLFRKGHKVWPSSNDITLDDTQDGTFTITYSFGPTVIVRSVKRAAIELICQMVQGESQALTRLRGIVSANVQGVSVTMSNDDVQNLGLPEVARFMDIFGSSGKGPVGAYSPELNHGWRLLEVSGPSGS